MTLGEDSTAGAIPAVELRTVSKRFGATLALDRVDLAIGTGEVHALVGQNGSGKSTLIKILAGYHAPDAGSELFVGGERVDPTRAYDPGALNLRFVHQGLGLIDEMDALDNIALAGGYVRARYGRIRWRRQVERTLALLAELGLAFDVRRPAGECSAVERTGIAIARALAGARAGGGLLVLDEPSVALTPGEAERLFDVVRRLAASGLSILYVSHYLDEVFAIADRVTVLRDGRVVADRAMSALGKPELIHLMVGAVLEAERRELAAASTAATGPALLSVRGLTAGELTDVDLDVRAGEVVGVAGTAGSGRDELALALVGAAGPTGGTVSLAGTELPAARSPRRLRDAGIVLVPADRARQGSVAEFTVSENMTLADLRPLRSPTGWLRRSVERRAVGQWLTDLDVRPHRPDAPIATLSGGNQQKVVLAKWLRLEPRLLVLDEPTSGVDVGARAMIYDIIRGQADRGLGVLVCSSDVDELAQLADRVVVLRHGRVVDELSGRRLTEAAILHAMEAGAVPAGQGGPR